MPITLGCHFVRIIFSSKAYLKADNPYYIQKIEPVLSLHETELVILFPTATVGRQCGI